MPVKTKPPEEGATPTLPEGNDVKKLVEAIPLLLDGIAVTVETPTVVDPMWLVAVLTVVDPVSVGAMTTVELETAAALAKEKAERAKAAATMFWNDFMTGVR